MQKNNLIGAWSLKSSVQSRNGVLSKTYGDPPSGQLQYTADGRMSAFLMNPDWKETGVNATQQADRFFSYGGQWEIIGNEVRHRIMFCSAPSKIGTTFVRSVKILGDDEIEITTAPETTRSGNVYETRLVWKRVS
jgi:hypothetical protein